MKYQQVSVDFINMLFTAFSYLALAGAVWVFLRLLQACFWLPRHLRKQNVVQQKLQEKVDSYEKYLQVCEENDKLLGKGEETEKQKESGETMEKPSSNANKWKDQKECLAMLKQELSRMRDGIYFENWEYLLQENESENTAKTEVAHSKVESLDGKQCDVKECEIRDEDTEDADKKDCGIEDNDQHESADEEENTAMEDKKDK